jgi:hypothetical protein
MAACGARGGNGKISRSACSGTGLVARVRTVASAPPARGLLAQRATDRSGCLSVPGAGVRLIISLGPRDLRMPRRRRGRRADRPEVAGPAVFCSAHPGGEQGVASRAVPAARSPAGRDDARGAAGPRRSVPATGPGRASGAARHRDLPTCRRAGAAAGSRAGATATRPRQRVHAGHRRREPARGDVVRADDEPQPVRACRRRQAGTGRRRGRRRPRGVRALTRAGSVNLAAAHGRGHLEPRESLSPWRGGGP